MQVVALQSRVGSLAAEGAQLRQELRESKARVAELEAHAAKSALG
jgi:hypothetical protein